ncbi:MAG: hypothetical protein ABI823_02435, partial [Bryobacteraceae bacterium]
TAVAGAIREKLPDAELFAVKVFDRRLSVHTDVIFRALDWCIRNRMDAINLSLGTPKAEYKEAFEGVLRRTSEIGILVVSAGEMLPGSLDGAIGAWPDFECSRDEYRVVDGRYYASGYPRPLPGLPMNANLQGVSFAVANLTGLLLRERLALEGGAPVDDGQRDARLRDCGGIDGEDVV